MCMCAVYDTVGHDSLVCAHALTCMCECVSTKPETMSAKHSVSPVSSELSAFIVCRMEFFGGGGGGGGGPPPPPPRAQHMVCAVASEH